jgi:hypothetical protein
MNLTNQLLQYSEQERLALISCITSIATIDKVASEDEIDFVLALIEAADLDAIKMKSIVATAKDPKNKNLQNNMEQVANNEDSKRFFTSEVLPLIRFNKELALKTSHLMQELAIDVEQFDSEENSLEISGKLIEGSFLEKMVLSLYLR